MARIADKEYARKLRAEGKSYSEIKGILNVSKSTLSGWLSDMPLSSEQINQLRALSPVRIERFRETMRLKRDERLKVAYLKVRRDIGALTKRDLFIAGLYLYWGEGTKAERGHVAIANTDYRTILAFLDWTSVMKVPEEKIKIRLQLYSDMNVAAETEYWSNILSIPITRFRKPHIKHSARSGLNYRVGHGHGTCNARFDDVALWEYITMALKYLGEVHSRP